MDALSFLLSAYTAGVVVGLLRRALRLATERG